MAGQERLRWRISSFKKLPPEMRPAFEKIEGALPSVKYENGRFYKIIWITTNPSHWPEELKVPLDSSDALVLDLNWGVRAEILGSML